MNTPQQFKKTGLSRSALLRRTTPSSTGKKDLTQLIKTFYEILFLGKLIPAISSSAPASSSSSTPKATKSISKINKEHVTLKKKLEFAAHKQLKDEEDRKEVNYEKLSHDELILLIEKRKEELNVLKRHEKEKEELTGLIEKWKEVGNDALEELENHFKMGRESLMTKLNLVQNLFD